MNGTYFKNPNFPDAHNTTPYLYPELNTNIWHLNIGKKVKVYASFPNPKDSVFSGIIEAVNADYLIMSDPSSGNWYLIPFKYIDYLEFEEKIVF